jgi:hypothetical protein
LRVFIKNISFNHVDQVCIRPDPVWVALLKESFRLLFGRDLPRLVIVALVVLSCDWGSSCFLDLRADLFNVGGHSRAIVGGDTRLSLATVGWRLDWVIT